MPIPLALPATLAPADVLADVLAVSLTPLALLRPLRDAAGTLLDFAVEHLNPAARELLGWPGAPAASFLQLFPAEPANGGFAFLADVLAGRAAEPREFAVQPGSRRRVRVAARRSGEWLVVSFSADPSAQEADQLLLAGETREAQALAEASRRHAQLYQVLGHAPGLIGLLAGPGHVFQFVNPALQALLGGRALLGLPLAEAVPELLGQPALALLDEAYRTGQPQRGTELPVWLPPGPDGRELPPRYFTLLYQPRLDAAGQVSGLLLFAYDVSEQVLARRQLEALNAELECRVAERTGQALAAQEQQRGHLYQLFEQVPAAIAVLDGPGLVVESVNPACRQLFEDRPLLGLPLFDALPELLESPIPAIATACYLTGQPYTARELLVPLRRTPTGPLEDTYWSFTYIARRDAQGEVDGLITFGYDVTAQVQARCHTEASQQHTQALADELGRANQQLQRTNVDLDTFIYAASHDLRAPISNLEGLLAALRQELRLPAHQADVETVLTLMHDSIQRFQRTIGYLTDVSRLQQAAAQPASAVALAALVEAVRLDLAPLLASTGGRLEVQVGDCPRVTFGEKNLRSIVYNLLSNAFKYRAPARPPVVRVRCHARPGYVVLEVQDNGLGLSESQRQRLFGMFQRLHDHVEGSGIGLYMVKKIVDNAGGYLEVESQPGVGSTFRVLLPSVPAAGSGSE